MPELVIANDFLESYAGLPKPVQKKTRAVFQKFREHTHAGIHLEKVNAAADDRARTIRIDQSWRGVVAAMGGAEDVYVFWGVFPHDDAYAWIETKRFGRNPLSGTAEVLDLRALGAHEEGAPAVEATSSLPLADVPDKHFRQLGVSEDVADLARRQPDLAALEGLGELLPRDQRDALLGLAMGMPVEAIWAELQARRPNDRADPSGHAGGLHHVVTDDADLKAILSEPLEQWRVFLHPTQKALAYRDSYAGPVYVTGGPGTGKTVVAVHRAVVLAERDPSASVLVTTYTVNLAREIAELVRQLSPAAATRIDVRNIDKLALGIASTRTQLTPDEAGGAEESLGAGVALVHQRVSESGTTADADPIDLLLDELRQVVLGRGLGTLREYEVAPRAGRPFALDRRDRRIVWKALQALFHHIDDYEWLAWSATRSLQGSRYTHAVIDEAQDLHSAHFGLVRRLVAPGPDDLFIVGDPHQRIYPRSVDLRTVGIDVGGRRHRLTINYRTTDEIGRFVRELLPDDDLRDLLGEPETFGGYSALMHGTAPEFAPAGSPEEEADITAHRITTWLEAGFAAEDIAVTAPSKWRVRRLASALEERGVQCSEVGKDGPAAEGVRYATMHRVKGLSFRCVLTTGLDEVPDEPEWRRTLLVAVSRAREEACLTWTGQRPGVLADVAT